VDVLNGASFRRKVLCAGGDSFEGSVVPINIKGDNGDRNENNRRPLCDSEERHP